MISRRSYVCTVLLLLVVLQTSTASASSSDDEDGDNEKENDNNKDEIKRICTSTAATVILFTATEAEMGRKQASLTIV